MIWFGHLRTWYVNGLGGCSKLLSELIYQYIAWRGFSALTALDGVRLEKSSSSRSL
jgi:hypothetical protein